ncbi:Sporulation protein YlmC, PRC-barrel domain family [Candidatus Methanophagaceae archaeon]|nr:Sporulation protein YlmC, PRC-barrel domain family [Methanophagales archaeon]
MKEEKMSAQKLGYKEVMDASGREIGELHNIIVDATTGRLTELVIKPASMLDTSGLKKENDNIIISIDAVKSIRDVIVLESEKMRKRA